MIKAYDKELLQEDLQSSKQFYIFFRSKGCRPCNEIKPELLQFTIDYDKLMYIVEENEGEEFQQKWGVNFYPTVVVAQNNKIQYKAEGIFKIRELL
jgi:thiol-disulfide isomerase/thioredoxin